MDVFQDENMYFEKKKSASDLNGIGKTICAFANIEGGILVIGVEDKIYGVSNPDEIQQKIFNILHNHFKPLPRVEIKPKQINTKTILLVHVFPFSNNICFFKGKAYLRIGSVNKSMEGEQLLDELKRKSVFSYEEQLNTYNLNEISSDKIHRYMEKLGGNNRPVRDILESLNLLEPTQSKLKNLALLLFARNPNRTIPQSGVKIAVFNSTSPEDLIKHKIIFDTVPELIDSTLDYILDNTSQEVIIEKRTTKYTYPPRVLLELISNALGHRDYFDQNLTQISIFTDRIEITNPGTPLISLSDLGRIARHRNPRLYWHLTRLGYVEGYGTGVIRVKSILKENGFLDPVFEEISGMFRVTVYNKNSISLDKKIQILLRPGPMRSSELSKKLAVSKVTVVNKLNKLISQGLVKKEGTGRDTKYSLTFTKT